MSAALKKEEARRLRANEKKWSAPLIDAGWTLIPSTILEKQAELALDPVDVNILLQIARHWWQAGNPPFPKIRNIAQCIGKHPSTVQRRITKLKQRGIIEVEHRYDKYGAQRSSKYHFKGLIELATPYAEETLVKREAKKNETATSRGNTTFKKSPKAAGLKIVKANED